MVDRVEVRGRRWKDVQGGLYPVQRIRLQQRVRQRGQVVDARGEHLAVFGQERRQGGKQTVNLLCRIGKLGVGVREPRGYVRQVLVQRDELLIVLAQRVDEKRQAAHHREEVAATLVERGQRLGQAG